MSQTIVYPHARFRINFNPSSSYLPLVLPTSRFLTPFCNLERESRVDVRTSGDASYCIDDLFSLPKGE